MQTSSSGRAYARRLIYVDHVLGCDAELHLAHNLPMQSNPAAWRDYVTAAGFFQVRHYYRPPRLPRHKQWWLSTVWRKG
jgi:hypothetical protein